MLAEHPSCSSSSPSRLPHKHRCAARPASAEHNRNGAISDKRLLHYDTEYDRQWAYMRGEDHWLGEDWWQAHVKSHIVLVYEPASLTGYLVHHPCTKRAKRSAIVLADIAGIVANRGKNPVCWVWNKAMRPEVLCPRVEVSGELKNRIAQLPRKNEIAVRNN